MPTASELTAEFAKKNDELGAFLEKVDLGGSPPQEQIDKFRELNAALADLGKQKDLALEIEGARAKSREIAEEMAKPVGRPSFGAPGTELERRKSLSFGEAVCSVLYAKDGSLIKNRDLEAKDFNVVEYKTTMTTAAGWGPESRRSGRVELIPTNPVMLMDLLPSIPVPTGTYTYMQETTYTNNADTVLEAAAYPESALALTPQTANIYKIGTTIPVTEEQFSDVDGMRAYVDGRLRTMVETKVENKILNATGTNDINGFYNQVTQIYALAGDDLAFDAIYKGMNKVRTIGYAQPDLVVMHPNDMVDIRLARTGDGIYIMGNPDVVGADRLFGVRVLQTNNATEGTALVGDFGTHSALLTRWGLDVLATNSHSDHWVKDIIDLKARERVGLAIFRILAFCEVTGI